jgi:VCBS repeat-containing protein
LGNDSDVDLPPPVLSAVLDSGPAHAAVGGFSLNADGSFTYLPDANYNGPDSFTYHASDGAADSSVVTVTLDVTPVNDAPSAANDSYSGYEDTLLAVGAPGVLGNDSDVDDLVPPPWDSLTPVLSTGPAHGSVLLNADGSFTYTPDLDYYGGDSFTYVANDGFLDSSPATVTLTVNPVPPVLFVDAAPMPPAYVGETGAFFSVAWGNLGPDDAPGAALDVGLTGPCTLISPSFPIVLGTIAEGDGGFQDVTVRADAVGKCTLTATLTSTRSNPPPSLASIDITAPPLPPGFVTGLLTFFGLSGPEGGPAPSGSAGPEVATPTPTALGTGPALPDEPTAQPTPPEPAAPEAPAAEPTPTPLAVSQGSLMADPGNPLAWGMLTLFGIWFGRMLVFKVRVPVQRTRRNAHYDEPATRPSRGR